jgi:hypothetical protein
MALNIWLSMQTTAEWHGARALLPVVNIIALGCGVLLAWITLVSLRRSDHRQWELSGAAAGSERLMRASADAAKVINIHMRGAVNSAGSFSTNLQHLDTAQGGARDAVQRSTTMRRD